MVKRKKKTRQRIQQTEENNENETGLFIDKKP